MRRGGCEDGGVSTAPRASSEFVAWLAARHPAVEGLRREHVEFNEELLPHVLFGDVTRYAAELARESAEQPRARKRLHALLADLDVALAEASDGDDEVATLVWVSFVENAQGVPGDDEEVLRDHLRSFPHLSEALSHYE